MLKFIKKNKFPVLVILVFIIIFIYSSIHPCEIPGTLFNHCIYLQAYMSQNSQSVQTDVPSVGPIPVVVDGLAMFFYFVVLPLLIIGVYELVKRIYKSTNR